MLRGADDVELYRRVFASHARVEVTFGEIVEYWAAGMVVFAGRETGQLTDPAGRNLLLRIRTPECSPTTRQRDDGPGAPPRLIDDPDTLRDYRHAIAEGAED